ncbi:MAG: cupin domain-containing protein, partial [Ornithinimicrobium sp.]
MHSRAAHLISSLGLAPHPEGGHFREVYRSAARVQPLDAR